jgi:hypothetical protein
MASPWLDARWISLTGGIFMEAAVRRAVHRCGLLQLVLLLQFRAIGLWPENDGPATENHH